MTHCKIAIKLYQKVLGNVGQHDAMLESDFVNMTQMFEEGFPLQ